MRTQDNFNKASGVAIRFPFMKLEKAESSRTHVSTFSKYPVVGLITPKSFWTHVSPFSVNPRRGLKTSRSSMPQAITFSAFKSTVINFFSVVVFMMVPIYANDQPDPCESNASRAHQVKTQGNSNMALKIIKITVHTNRTIGMVISISLLRLEKIRSSETRASTFFVFGCIVVYPFSIVVPMTLPIYAKDQPDTCESNSPGVHQVKGQGKHGPKDHKDHRPHEQDYWNSDQHLFAGVRKKTIIRGMQVICRYGLTESGIGANEFLLKDIEELSVSPSLFQIEPLRGDF